MTRVPRNCGICPISRWAARALAPAVGEVPNAQGARVAALIPAVASVADHLTRVALFFMPDVARPLCAGARLARPRGAAVPH